MQPYFILLKKNTVSFPLNNMIETQQPIQNYAIRKAVPSELPTFVVKEWRKSAAPDSKGGSPLKFDSAGWRGEGGWQPLVVQTRARARSHLDYVFSSGISCIFVFHSF